MLPSRSFAESADQHLQAGRPLIRRWKVMHDTLADIPATKARHEEPPAGEAQSAPGPDLVVEHEHGELTLRDGIYRTRVRRHLRNTRSHPVTRYLIRISVGRHPGDPERSNRLYREDPLTWEEIGLSALCGEEPMTCNVKHDRDASKDAEQPTSDPQ